jgi:hypothetical protein
MRTLIWGLAWSLSVVLFAPAAMAQDRGLAIAFTVADIPASSFT